MGDVGTPWASGHYMASVESGRESTASETAQYIEGMARELGAMAAKADLGFLAYLLSMAEQEARRTVSASQTRPDSPRDG